LGVLGWVFFTAALGFWGSAVMTVSAEVVLCFIKVAACASCTYSWLGWQMISAAGSRRCVLVIHGYSKYQQNDVFLYALPRHFFTTSFFYSIRCLFAEIYDVTIHQHIY
jgi:hypothetical protein